MPLQIGAHIRQDLTALIFLFKMPVSWGMLLAFEFGVEQTTKYAPQEKTATHFEIYHSVFTILIKQYF